MNFRLRKANFHGTVLNFWGRICLKVNIQIYLIKINYIDVGKYTNPMDPLGYKPNIWAETQKKTILPGFTLRKNTPTIPILIR